jgi:hypothetical protein
LSQLQIGEPLHKVLFNRLNFIVEVLNFIGGSIVKVFVKLRHGASFEGGLAVPVFEECKNAPWVDDLV